MRAHLWSLLALTSLGACGSDKTFVDGGLDGTTGDPDATVGPDAAAGAAVTVTVHDWRTAGQPVVGAAVLAVDAAGAVVGRAATDAAGEAASVVPAGGSLLVVDRTGNLTSFLGLVAGDHLFVGTAITVGTATNGTVVVPAGPAGTVRYQVSGACTYGASVTPRITVGVSDACPAGARDVVATAFSAATRLGYLHGPAAAVAPGATVTLPGPWAAPGSFAVALGGVPASVSQIQLRHGVMFGAALATFDDDALPAAVAGAVAATFPHPAALGDGTTIGLRVIQTGGLQTIDRYQAGQVNRFDIGSLDGELLPALADVTPTGDGLSWTLGGGAAYDGALVRLEALEKGATRATWRFVLPAGATRVVLPTLPADLADDWAPIDGVAAQVELIDSHVTTARDFRQTIFTTALDAHAGTSPSTVRRSTSETRF